MASVFSYTTVKSMLALLLSFVLMLVLMPFFIRFIKRTSLCQVIREDGPSSHKNKVNTPTMGGALIMAVFVLSACIFVDLKIPQTQGLLLTVVLFGMIGLWDDLLNITKKNAYALSGRNKFLLQLLAAALVAGFVFFTGVDINHQMVPMVQNFKLYLPFLLVMSALIFLMVGSSNAVNLTDGLDGLVSVPLIYVCIGLGVLSYFSSHFFFAQYLNLPYLPFAKELVVCCAAFIGSILGFLWYNHHPAEIFMGDVGSLMMGAALAYMAFVLQQVFLWGVMSGLFVIEVLSVMIQVTSFKLTGKRVFKMAPLHHHFELSGWSEPKVIIRFWMLSGIFFIISLLMVKAA